MNEDVEELFPQLTGEANNPQHDKKIYMHISLLEIFKICRGMTIRKNEDWNFVRDWVTHKEVEER